MKYSNRKTQIGLRIRTACFFSHMPSVPGNRGLYSSDCTDLQTGLDFGFADTLTTFAAQRILVQRLQKCSINCVQLHLKGNRNTPRFPAIFTRRNSFCIVLSASLNDTIVPTKGSTLYIKESTPGGENSSL